MELAAFCGFNGLGELIPYLYAGGVEDRVFAEAVIERTEKELARLEAEHG